MGFRTNGTDGGCTGNAIRQFTLTVFQENTYGFKKQTDLDDFDSTVNSGGCWHG